MVEEEKLRVTPKPITGQPALDAELAMAEFVSREEDPYEQTQPFHHDDPFHDEPDEAELALVGTIFAEQYEILHVLGRGGMSVVYRARDQYLKQDVAIKTLHRTLTYDQNSLRRFQQEAATALNLDHQNIVRVRNFGISLGLPYMAMDLLEGVSFSDLIKKHDLLPVPHVLHIFSQACAGLAHAHGKGIIHRDIKPSNIMLMHYDGDPFFVKILDFGIAKLLPQDGEKISRLTQTGEIFGSPVYMCPEQWSGKAVDSRSDVYSLGCVLYETLQGRPPFFDSNVFETMHQHLMELPPPLDLPTMDRALCDRLEAVIFRAMEKQPEKRYQTMADFKKDIDAIAGDLEGGKLGRSLAAEFSRTGRQFKRAVVKVRPVYVALGILVASIAVLAGGFTWLDVGWFFRENSPVVAEFSWPPAPELTALAKKMSRKIPREVANKYRQHMEDLNLTMEITQMQYGRDSEQYAARMEKRAEIALKCGQKQNFLESLNTTAAIYSEVDKASPRLADARIVYAEALLADGSDDSVGRAAGILQQVLPFQEKCTYFDPNYATLLLGDIYYSKAAKVQLAIEKLTAAQIQKTDTAQMSNLSALISEQERMSVEAQQTYRMLWRAGNYDATITISDRDDRKIPLASAYTKARLADLQRWYLQNRKLIEPDQGGNSNPPQWTTLQTLEQSLYASALQEFKKGGNKQDSAKVSYYLGFLAEQKGDWAQARTYYAGAVGELKEMLKSRPSDLNVVLCDYARVLWKNQDFTEAIHVRKEAANTELQNDTPASQ